MWIVAIATGDPGLVHEALHERAVNIDLVFNLAICEIQGFVEQCKSVRVGERFAVFIVGRDNTAP